ncbi:MAG: hypothetical protein JSV49_07770 [Thermoplasmata archaeon]|nr:MAG: hypothetical protein JSV49_07770 [Thermoplasmata archaeon]
MQNRIASAKLRTWCTRVIAGLIILMMVGSSSVSAVDASEPPMVNPVPPPGFVAMECEQLTFNGHRSIQPNILIDNEDNLHLIWSDSCADPIQDDNKFIHTIFYKKFDKFGELIIDDTQLMDISEYGPYPYNYFFPGPKAAFDSEGNIHIAYADAMRNDWNGWYPNFEIYYMKLNGGASASPANLVLVDEQRVSEGVVHSGSPDIAVDSEDNVHIVWYDHRSCNWNYEIYYEKLATDGTVLIDDMAITDHIGYCAGSSIAVDSQDNLHIAFKCYDWWTMVNSQYYLKMDNDGNILIDAKIFADEGKPTPRQWYKGYPIVEVDSSDFVHMAWYDERWSNDYEVSYLKLDNNGEPVMAEPLRVSETPGKSTLQEFVLGPDGNLYILWRDNTPGDYQIYMAILNTDGGTVLDPYQLTVSASLSESPSVAFDSASNIHIAWADTITYIPEIYKTVLKPQALELAFVASGVPGSSANVAIYKGDSLIKQLNVVRTAGDPMANAVIVNIPASAEDELRIEFSLNPTAKARGNGAMPIKVFAVENGELTDKLGEITLCQNNGKNPKLTAIILI